MLSLSLFLSLSFSFWTGRIRSLVCEQMGNTYVHGHTAMVARSRVHQIQLLLIQEMVGVSQTLLSSTLTLPLTSLSTLEALDSSLFSPLLFLPSLPHRHSRCSLLVVASCLCFFLLRVSSCFMLLFLLLRFFLFFFFFASSYSFFRC
jgi:hypothetical protein